MQDRVTYEYAIIRLMPKVEREEFLNVGVILFSKPLDYLNLKFVLDKEKISCFSKDLELEEISDYLEAWQKIAIGNKEGSLIERQETPSRFRWLTASKSTILSCSKVHPGLCINPDEVLEELFEKFVL